MWLKKSVGISLIAVSLLVSVVLVWGLVFTKDPSESANGVESADANGQKVAIADTAQQGSQAGAAGTGQPTDAQAQPTTTSPSTTTATPTSTGGTGSGTPAGGSSTSGGGTQAPAAVAPTVTLTASPTTITSGASSTLGWSINNTATAPVTCTASGAWSGSRATSGSQAVTPTTTSTYTLACSNAAGSNTKSVTVTVNAAAPTYCGGQTPCYGVADLAAHATTGNCWGYVPYNGTSVMYNLSGFAPNHSGGSGTILTSSTCGKDLTSALNSAPGNSKHTSAKHNTQGTLLGYKVGYFDAAKP